MLAAPIPEYDEERVSSLESMGLLSTPLEADFDRITRMAKRVFNSEFALISLVDRDRQWFKSRQGLDATETPRDISFCGHAIHQDEAFVVTDASMDERFHDNPLVISEPNIRFYAGQPLVNADGYRVGTLCVISSEARDFSADEQQTLADLGRMVELVFDNRELSESQKALLDSLATKKRKKLIDPATGVWNRDGFGELFKREVSRAVRAKTTFAVATAKIDGMRQIKDALGEDAGEEAINLTASLLVEASRATDVVARFKSDTFAMVFPDAIPAMLPSLCEKMLVKIRPKANLAAASGDRAFSISLGVTICTPKKDRTADMTQLIDMTLQALHTAQYLGGNRYEITGVPDQLFEAFALA